MEQDIERVLIDRAQIARRCDELAGEIVATYQGRPGELWVVAVLSGAFVFLSDLIRRIPIRMRLTLLHVSSYPGRQTRSTEAVIEGQLPRHLAGRDVLIVDDILDSGKTLRAVIQRVWRQQPASVRTCVLLRKPDKAPSDVPADFVGFDIEDAFVVGYGLDYGQLYRNYPDIGVLRAECY